MANPSRNPKAATAQSTQRKANPSVRLLLWPLVMLVASNKLTK